MKGSKLLCGYHRAYLTAGASSLTVTSTKTIEVSDLTLGVSLLCVVCTHHIYVIGLCDV